MRNERGSLMKKIICVILLVCIFPACAFALDLSEFNLFAAVVGVPELTGGKTSGNYTGFVQDDCFIYFDESGGKLSGIYIEGKGDTFLAYCCAAIHVFDKNGKTTVNHGQLLTMYLMAHTETEHQTGQTTNGVAFFVEPSEKGYTFMIGE